MAAETRTEAKERQIKELTGIIEEAKKNNSMLTEKLKKITSKKIKMLKTRYIWLLVIGFLSGMLFSGIIFYYLNK